MPITVNGVEISDAAIHAEMTHHPAPSRELAEYAARLALLAKELLTQEAARLVFPAPTRTPASRR